MTILKRFASLLLYILSVINQSVCMQSRGRRGVTGGERERCCSNSLATRKLITLTSLCAKNSFVMFLFICIQDNKIIKPPHNASFRAERCMRFVCLFLVIYRSLLLSNLGNMRTIRAGVYSFLFELKYAAQDSGCL